MQKYHLDLQYLLAASAKELALEKQLITDMMFGDDLQQAHKDLLAKKKVTAITSTPKKKKTNHNYMQNPATPFLGFGLGSPHMSGWGSPQQGHGHFHPWTSNNTGFHGGHSSCHQGVSPHQAAPSITGWNPNHSQRASSSPAQGRGRLTPHLWVPLLQIHH